MPYFPAAVFSAMHHSIMRRRINAPHSGIVRDYDFIWRYGNDDDRRGVYIEANKKTHKAQVFTQPGFIDIPLNKTVLMVDGEYRYGCINETCYFSKIVDGL